MVEKLEDGSITLDMTPKEAYRSDLLFFQYSKTAFKNQLKNSKNEHGVSGCHPNMTNTVGEATGK